MSEPYARQVESKPYVAFAFEQITVSNTAIGFTLATQQSAKKALVSIETNAVRYRSDPTNPTATVGMLASVGDQLVFIGPEIINVKFIRATADALISVEYSR